MDNEAQLKLQAYLDGELPEAEAREVANWLARDRDAAALHNELKNTRQALVGHETGIQLPESREFFWSKLEREIQRAEPREAVANAVPWAARIRRFLMPVSGLAVLVVASMLTFNNSSTHVSEMETSDSGAFTYHDDAAGATLVWLSHPLESDPADEDDLDIE